MIKSLSLISLLTTAALAQSASSSASAAAASSTSSPLIPSGISSGCSAFLIALNSDSTLTTCTAPLIAATSAYGPTSNSTTSPSTASITSTLNAFCSGSGSSSCSASAIRGKLADFYSACSAELTSSPPNKDVIRIYDVLFILNPLTTAVCSKDDSGAYCVTQTSSTLSNSSSSAPAPSGLNNNAVATNTIAGFPVNQIQKYLAASSSSPGPARRDVAALIPNTTTFAATNLVFLFLQPSLPYNALCTSCTRNVLTAYINFESDVPYAAGISASPMLANQPALYAAVQSTCGKSFLSGVVQAAGGLSGGLMNGAPGLIGAGFPTATVAVMFGAVAIAFASLL